MGLIPIFLVYLKMHVGIQASGHLDILSTPSPMTLLSQITSHFKSSLAHQVQTQLSTNLKAQNLKFQAEINQFKQDAKIVSEIFLRNEAQMSVDEIDVKSLQGAYTDTLVQLEEANERIKRMKGEMEVLKKEVASSSASSTSTPISPENRMVDQLKRIFEEFYSNKDEQLVDTGFFWRFFFVRNHHT